MISKFVQTYFEVNKTLKTLKIALSNLPNRPQDSNHSKLYDLIESQLLEAEDKLEMAKVNIENLPK